MGDIRLFIVLIVAFAVLVGLLYKTFNRDKENIYVYPKTKNRYLAKGIVKMKDSAANEWVDAILYISLKNGNYYVREEKQFFDKFITLKEWRKQCGKVK